jgi:Aspartate carbamoyltransferase regulatory chain, metal binding domain
VLGLTPFATRETPAPRKIYGHVEGMRCPNPRCITQHPSEKAHLAPKFWFIRSSRPLARCVYCETDTEIARYVDLATRMPSSDFDRLPELAPGDVLLFATAEDARKAGYGG